MEKVIECLQKAKTVIEMWVPMFYQYNTPAGIDKAITMLEKQEQKWISVEDRLPEIRHAVLAYNPFHKNIWAVSMHEDGEWYYWIPSTKKYDPDWQGPITHWMPMPEMPDD